MSSYFLHQTKEVLDYNLIVKISTWWTKILGYSIGGNNDLAIQCWFKFINSKIGGFTPTELSNFRFGIKDTNFWLSVKPLPETKDQNRTCDLFSGETLYSDDHLSLIGFATKCSWSFVKFLLEQNLSYPKNILFEIILAFNSYGTKRKDEKSKYNCLQLILEKNNSKTMEEKIKFTKDILILLLHHKIIISPKNRVKLLEIILDWTTPKSNIRSKKIFLYGNNVNSIDLKTKILREYVGPTQSHLLNFMYPVYYKSKYINERVNIDPMETPIKVSILVWYIAFIYITLDKSHVMYNDNFMKEKNLLEFLNKKYGNNLFLQPVDSENRNLIFYINLWKQFEPYKIIIDIFKNLKIRLD